MPSGSIRFPMNKHLVTSSMVLWAGGWCYLLMAAFYLVIDVWRFSAWAFPFTVIGMNAIAAYMIAHPYYLRLTSDAYVAGWPGWRALWRAYGETAAAAAAFAAVVADPLPDVSPPGVPPRVAASTVPDAAFAYRYKHGFGLHWEE